MRMLIAKFRRRRNRRILLRHSRWCVRISKLQLSLLDRRSRLFKEKQRLKLETPSSESGEEHIRQMQAVDRELENLNLMFPLGLQSEQEQTMLEDMQLLHRNMITVLQSRS